MANTNEWWIPVLQSGVPTLIAVTGWVVSHVLTLRSQKKNFENQILDRARTEITEAIRLAQNWYTKVLTTLADCSASLSLEEKGHQIYWYDKLQKIFDLIQKGNDTVQWTLRLEDYLVLFPESASVRVELQIRDQTILNLLGRLHSSLMVAGLAPHEFEQRKELFEKNEDTKRLVDSCFEQAALFEDLRIYLQNKVLARISGNPIPPRVPRNPEAKRIEKGEKGMLVVRTTSEINR